MEYNTARPKMEIPEYGRITMKLAQHLLTIEDREKRNTAARALIDIMSFSTPQFRNIEEYKMKLWDHLHIMTDYKLDVDSPYPKPKKKKAGDEKPAPLAYPKNKIKYRNYGKNLERLLDVGGRRGDRHQRQHRVAFADVVLDPLLVDRDVAFEEMKARMAQQVRNAVGLHVHAVDLPISGLDDATGQVMADKAVDAKDEHFHEVSFNTIKTRGAGW